MHSFSFESYRFILLFLVIAGVVAPLFRKIKMSPILGYLLAGTVLGPFGLGKSEWARFISFPDLEEAQVFSELGIVFLLFTIGLELSFDRLRRMRRLVFGLGGIQVVCCGAVLANIAHAFGQTWEASLVIGAALALSSTAMVIPSLAEHQSLHKSVGRITFAILLFQDLVVAPLLFLLSFLSGPSHEIGVQGFIETLAIGIGTLAILIWLGHWIIRPLFRMVASTKSTEFFMAACLLVVGVTGLISSIAGLGVVLGAFLAGLLLAETQYRREVEVNIAPFKGLLLGLFFVSIGARLDLNILVQNPIETIGIAVGFVLLKGAFTTLAGRLFSLEMREAWQVGFLTGTGGEFAFVLLSTVASAQIIPPLLISQLMVSVTLSMLCIPFLVGAMARLKPSFTELEMQLSQILPSEDETSRVIIVGYGRVGRLVGEMLAYHKIPYIAVDMNAKLVEYARNEGKDIFFGNATRLDFLQRCGLMQARALVITLDASHAVDIVVKAARAEREDLTIITRARDARHASHLYEIGATDAVPETLEASLQLSEAVLVDIGVPAGYVIASIHEKRDEFRKILQAPPESHRHRHAIRPKATQPWEKEKEPKLASSHHPESQDDEEDSDTLQAYTPSHEMLGKTRIASPRHRPQSHYQDDNDQS